MVKGRIDPLQQSRAAGAQGVEQVVHPSEASERETQLLQSARVHK